MEPMYRVVNPTGADLSGMWDGEVIDLPADEKGVVLPAGIAQHLQAYHKGKLELTRVEANFDAPAAEPQFVDEETGEEFESLAALVEAAKARARAEAAAAAKGGK